MEENIKYIIGVDGMGGDNAPAAIVEGVIDAIKVDSGLKIKIFGIADLVNAELKKYKFNPSQIEVVHCAEVIDNHDTPNVAIRTKKDSSLVVALNALKAGEIGGLVSAGSTGAVLMGGFMKIGRLQGVHRPGLAPLMPTSVEDKQVLLLDCGANLDPRPEHIAHFAVMGSEVMKSACGIENPKVGLLNIGAESSKGPEFLKLANELIGKIDGVNFLGNVEPRYALNGEYDVVVADGVSGNIFLKSTEGAAKMFSGILKKSIKKHFWSKMGALLMGKTFKEIKSTMNYHKYGGSLFVGIKGVLIKSHGSSNALNISTSIKQVIKYYSLNLNDNIKAAIEKANSQIKTEGDSE